MGGVVVGAETEPRFEGDATLRMGSGVGTGRDLDADGLDDPWVAAAGDAWAFLYGDPP
jgi:hypothetical protein